MIVDSSALIGLLFREPGHDWIADQLATAPAAVGAPTLAEAGIVLAARIGIQGRTLLARLVDEAGLAIVPFQEQHAAIATVAYQRFGRGKHPAGLNFGDCLAYAVARLANEPLLCLREDFAKTDLQVVSR